MSLSKKQRIATVSVAGSALWFILWGMGGYFFGLRGVGYGWPAFWVVAGMSLITPAVTWGLVTVFLVSREWIERGEK